MDGLIDLHAAFQKASSQYWREYVLPEALGGSRIDDDGIGA